MKTIIPAVYPVKFKYVGKHIPGSYQYSIHTRTRQIFDQLGIPRDTYDHIENWFISFIPDTSRIIEKIEVDICYKKPNNKCVCTKPVWSFLPESHYVTCDMCGITIGIVYIDELMVVRETEREMKVWLEFTDSIEYLKQKDPTKFKQILDLYQKLYFDTCCDYIDIISEIKKFIQ